MMFSWSPLPSSSAGCGSCNDRRSAAICLLEVTPLGSLGNNGSLGLPHTGSERPHADSGPLCGPLGSPEMVSEASTFQ